jgi:O-antigen biosynthesis protein
MTRAVTTVAHQSLDPADYEVIVVNNDAGDRCVAERLDEIRRLDFTQCPERLRLVDCPLVGLSHARNAGISEAKGEILCFLDDDALATPTWLEQIWESFRTHPECGLIGGTIRLNVPEPRPAALLPGAESYWGQLLPSYNGFTTVHRSWEYPWGGNWCARRRALLEIGGFRTRYGRQGTNFAGGEELLAAALIARLGHSVGINPYAEVIHSPSPDRFTWEYLRKTMVSGDVTHYFLQQDLYVPIYISIKRTLLLILRIPGSSAIKGPISGRLRYHWYRKTSYLRLLRQELADWWARGHKPVPRTHVIEVRNSSSTARTDQ